MHSFGNRLATLRAGQHRTQEDVAHAAGITVQHYSKLERGVHSPTLDTIYALARAFGVTPGTLIGKKSDKTGQDSRSYREDIVPLPSVS